MPNLGANFPERRLGEVLQDLSFHATPVSKGIEKDRELLGCPGPACLAELPLTSRQGVA